MGEGEHWYKEAVIYEVHVKCFYDGSGDGIGDFRGLTAKLDYLQDLGVTAIWLLPFYPSPLRDDGYDIADYTEVHPQYGTLTDFKHFLREAHRRGLKVITELVINHTSDQHPWFQRARQAKSGSNARDFYVWSETPEKYKETRIIFQDYESSNWTWDPVAGSYYWHRFYSHQPDLNFDNPEVQKAVLQKLGFWLKLGVDGVRLDAIPYLYEREGTICENLPETHAFLKKLRAYVDAHFADRMLLAEANQWPEEAVSYFGEGDECHMAFHFPVMPRLFMSIHLEDSLPIIEIMGQTPAIPESCQWALFLRNHDELTLEMVTDEERDYMFRVYAHDPQARLNLGIRRRLAPLLKNDRRKIELMNALLFSLTGTPVLYYGDELGMGDNIYLGDRDGVRTPMQWSSDRNAGFSRANPQQLYLPTIIDPEYHYETVNVEAQQANPHSLLWWTKQMIALRRRYKAFSYGATTFLRVGNRKVLVFFREYHDELVMIVANLSRFPQYVELELQQYDGYSLIEMFSGESFPKIGELPYFLTLGPYGYYWFSLTREPAKGRRAVPEVALDPMHLFRPSMRRSLEAILKKYLQKTKLHVVDHFTLPEHEIHFVLVEIAVREGVVEQIPLYLRLAEESTGQIMARFSGSALVLVDLERSREVGEALKAKKWQPCQRGTKRGELEVFTQLDEGMNLDIEMRLFLQKKTDFRAFVPLLGYVPYGERALALEEESAKGTSAKELAIAAAERFLMRMETTPVAEIEALRLLPEQTLLTVALGELDPAIHALLEEHLEVAHHLGETTAELHKALDSERDDPDFAPLPFTLFYQRSIYQSIRSRVLERVPEELHEAILDLLKHLPHYKMHAERIRCHGEYRLEHLLYTGKAFLIRHFESQADKPYFERRYKRCPLIDCAALLLSLAEASFSAIDRMKERGIVHEEELEQLCSWAHMWAHWNGASFLRAYLQTLGDTSFLPDEQRERDFLLAAFLVEQCAERIDQDAALWTLKYWVPIYQNLDFM